jgi:hypothetical protein
MPDSNPVRITADTSGFDAAMREMSATAEEFAHRFSGALRQAVIAGDDLDDALRRVILRLSDGALARALAPLEDALGSALGTLVSGGRAALGGNGGSGNHVTVNVTAQDAASFRKSENQIAGMLTRLAGRGGRST